MIFPLASGNSGSKYVPSCLEEILLIDSSVQLFNAGVRFKFNREFSSTEISQIILASIVSKSPGCHVAATAFVELNLAVNIYGRGAASTRRARSGLVSIIACII